MQIEKLMQWEDMALSSLIWVLVKWFNCDNFTLETTSRPSVETRVWFALKFELPEWTGKHESSRMRYVHGSSLEIVKRRLIKCLDDMEVCKARLEKEPEPDDKAEENDPNDSRNL